MPESILFYTSDYFYYSMGESQCNTDQLFDLCSFNKIISFAGTRPYLVDIRKQHSLYYTLLFINP